MKSTLWGVVLLVISICSATSNVVRASVVYVADHIAETSYPSFVSFLGASIYTQGEYFTPVATDGDYGANAIVSQTFNATLPANVNSNSGEAQIDSTLSSTILGVSMEVSATSEVNEASGVDTLSVTGIQLFFDVVGGPQSFDITTHTTIVNNLYTSGGVYMYISDMYQSGFDYFDDMTSAPSGTTNHATLTLPPGQYKLYAVTNAFQTASSGNEGPNTSAGVFDITILIPEPSSFVLLTASFTVLFKRRKMRP